MLQIRLNKPFVEGGGGLKPLPEETVTVACPDHLVIADLPVAKGIGGATSTSLVKTVGRRSRRQLGERVHFCVRCDFPIAVYGRLSPCEHAICLDCARSDSICYLCEERIQKIQTIKMMEGIFICAAPHCLKSFLKRIEFEAHIQENHADLLKSNTDKDIMESEAQSVEQSAASDSTARGQARTVFSPDGNTQEDKARRQQSWEQQSPRQIVQLKPPQMFGQVSSYPSDPQIDNRSQGLPSVHNQFHQQSFDAQGALPQEFGQFPVPEYPPMQSVQPPGFSMPVISNPMLTPPPYGFPSFPPEGARPFYGAAPHKMARQDSAVNFSASGPQTWNTEPSGVPFESPTVGPGAADGSTNPSDTKGKLAFYQGDYERSSGVMSLNHPAMPMAGNNNAMEAPQVGNMADPRDLASQPLPIPSPSQAHSSHLQQGNFYPYETGRDAQNFGWQHENRDSFPGGQD